jgi:hypothetical protein
MSKKALCIGIDGYPGAASDWAGKLPLAAGPADSGFRYGKAVQGIRIARQEPLTGAGSAMSEGLHICFLCSDVGSQGTTT